MKRAIFLYIGTNSERADLGDASFLLFNWATTDVTEVAKVKNGYSCQVTLPGTPTNDIIFGSIHLNDRETVISSGYTGINFDPSRRTPFAIYDDGGGLLEAGYLKLDQIVTNLNLHEYKVTLYGGLGGFLYDLAYDSLGNKRSLADLAYKLHGSNTEETLDFQIDVSTVRDAWARLGTHSKTDWPSNDKWEIINFAPCYNGCPAGVFSPEKALYPSGGFLPSVVDTYYKPKPGGDEVLVTFPTKKTEWETRDLRSYLQRPVLRLAAFIEAICDTANNGGYNVDLSESELTPASGPLGGYWLTLPLLQDLVLDVHEYNSTFSVNEGSPTTLPTSPTPGMPLMYQIQFYPRFYITGADNLHLYFTDYLDEPNHIQYLNVLWIKVNFLSGGVKVAEDSIFASSMPAGTYIPYGYGSFPAGQYTTHSGWFQGASGQGNWRGDPLVINFPSDTSYDSIEIVTNYVAFAWDIYDLDLNVPDIPDKVWDGTAWQTVTGKAALPGGKVSGALTTKSRSYATVTKQALLSGDKTPADYLLSICKMMNHRIVYDPATKTVKICSQQNYWNGGTVDLTYRINRSKPITKTPLQFAARWYEWRSDYGKGEYAQYYETVYGRRYGSQRVNTGYEFNADTLEVVDSVVFRGAVQILEPSQYFVDVNANDFDIPPALIESGTTYALQDSLGKVQNVPVPSVDYSIRNYLNGSHPYFDLFDKAQFHDADNKANDERDTLLCYDTMVDVTDKGYRLTDDTVRMMDLNNDTPCWLLYTPESGRDLYYIPHFSRLDGNKMLDFGVPAEIPIPGVGGAVALQAQYNLYWQSFIQGAFTPDNGVLRCHVNLEGIGRIGPDLLRNVYYFDDATWRLNKIINYSLTTLDDTECEFIRVQ